MAIRVGIIGAGRMGQTHVRSLAALPGVVIAAVSDNDRALAEACAAPFGASVHLHFRNLIESERLDAVFVCVPPFAHGDPEVLAARTGLHLFIEPPVALNVQKAREVQKEIEKSGVVAAVSYPWRRLSGVQRLQEMLKDRRPVLMTAWRLLSLSATDWRRRREASGGLVLQAANDLVDLARFCMGEITSVFAAECRGVGVARAPDCDIEDGAVAALAFRSGAVGQVTCSTVTPHEHSAGVRFFAEDMEVTFTPSHLEVFERGRLVRQEHEGSGLEALHTAFLEAVHRGRPSADLPGYAEGVAALNVCLAARESAQSGQRVNL